MLIIGQTIQTKIELSSNIPGVNICANWDYRSIAFTPSGYGNIHGTFQECYGECSFKNDALIVQNENCMNVQVRMFIECSELNAK